MIPSKQIFSYSIVNIINAAVPFLLLPILTTYLAPNEYGLLSLIQLLMVISLPILLMNTAGLLTIEYSRLSFDKFQTLLSTLFWIPIVGFILLECIFFYLEEFIVKYFHIPSDYIFLIPLFVLVQAIPTIVPIIFQAKKQPLNFGKYKISLTIVNLLLSLLFVVVFNYSWEGRLWGIIGAFSVFSLIGIVILIKLNLLRFKFDLGFLKEALHFGIPLIPHSIAGVFLAMSDRVFLANMLGNDAVGIYSVAFQVASAVAIIMTSINQAWAPTLFEKLNNNPTLENKRKIVKETYKIMLGMVLVTTIFILSSSLIFQLFINEAFSSAVELSQLIAVAFLFQGFYFMITNYIFFSKKTYFLSYITLLSVIIIFIANYFLIPEFGIYGAAYAMLISWIIFFIITWIVSNKIYKMPWRL